MARPPRFTVANDPPADAPDAPRVDPAVQQPAAQILVELQLDGQRFPEPLPLPEESHASRDGNVDFGFAAKQQRFRKRLRYAAALILGLGGSGLIYGLVTADSDSEAQTKEQASQPVREVAPQPAPSAETDNQSNLVPNRSNWIIQNQKSPVGSELTGAIKSQMDSIKGNFAYTIECNNGTFTGENFMHWRSASDQPNVTDWSADVIQMGNYGQVSHPEIACKELGLTGQASVIWN